MITYPLSLVYDLPKDVYIDPITGISSEISPDPYGLGGPLIIKSPETVDVYYTSAAIAPVLTGDAVLSDITLPTWDSYEKLSNPLRLMTVSGDVSYSDLANSTTEVEYGLSTSVSNLFINNRPVAYAPSSVYAPTLPIDSTGYFNYLSSSPLPSYEEAKFNKRIVEKGSLEYWLGLSTNISQVDYPSWLNWFDSGLYIRRAKEPNYLHLLSANFSENDTKLPMLGGFSYNNVAHEKMQFNVVLECEISNLTSIKLAKPVGRIYAGEYTRKDDDDSTWEYKWWGFDWTVWSWTTETGFPLSSNPPLSTYAGGEDVGCFYNNLDCKANLPMMLIDCGNNGWPTNKAISAALSSGAEMPFGGWEVFKRGSGVNVTSIFPSDFKFTTGKTSLRQDGEMNEHGYIPRDAGPNTTILQQEPAPEMEYTVSLKDIVVGGYLLYPTRDGSIGNYSREIPIMGFNWSYTGDGASLYIDIDTAYATIKGTDYRPYEVNVNNAYNEIHRYTADITTYYNPVTGEPNTYQIETGLDIPVAQAGLCFPLNTVAKRLDTERWGLLLFLRPVWIDAIPSEGITNDYSTLYSAGLGTSGSGFKPEGVLRAPTYNSLPYVPVMFEANRRSRRLPSAAKIAGRLEEKLVFEYDSCPYAVVTDALVNHLNNHIPYFGARASIADPAMETAAIELAKKMKFSVYIKEPNFVDVPNSRTALRHNKARFSGDFFSTLSASSFSQHSN